MKYRLKTLSLAIAMLAASLSGHAQGLHLAATPALTPNQTATATTQADFIVAVVNSEPITNTQVSREIQRVLQQLTQQRRAQPDVRVLASEVLENLISIKAQLQYARDTNVRVEDSAVDQAIQNIAQQNQLNVPELMRRVQNDGLSASDFRAQLQDQIMLQRLRERDVGGRVRVSDLEVDQYLTEQKSNQNLSDIQLNLAQILVSVPETASPEQIAALRKRAERALERARKGEDFAALVREFSDASDLVNAGQLGLREASRYPALFVDATRLLDVGAVAELVRSPAGFHVLKVVEKIHAGLPTAVVTQSHARHILLIPNARLSEAQAREELASFKKQLVSGKADFATLAREHSQDGSAAQGGDLGWASPGMFVPEFEAVINRLTPGEVSDPLVSRFGVHLIQLQERRQVTLSQEQQREAVRAMLREKKMDETYKTWAQDLRARAYVELREPPQ
ncbi:chaperone SurA [Rhodoferax lithotrophicus]|uniref:Chaperone SurA n=1 Tax=Rhodoferax lithotrophicus TaxID=2798804 RepID=A0ABN6CZU6_9BURK|nr:peptidylprolyl isomerase [Rhodoferax sp. MIZ03]BCO25301.1 chaperone SurA [Rhodoferax sp. MIZ03]